MQEVKAAVLASSILTSQASCLRQKRTPSKPSSINRTPEEFAKEEKSKNGNVCKITLY